MIVESVKSHAVPSVHKTQLEMPETEPTPVPEGLPAGAQLLHVKYVTVAAVNEEVVVEFPLPIQCKAVVVTNDPGQQSVEPAQLLTILSIPIANQDEAELLSNVREWVDALSPAGDPKSHMMTLQGAQLFWTSGRLAILAHPSRLVMLRRALIEAYYYESELRSIEADLGMSWPQFEADLPLAFEFNESALDKRKQLLQRFRNILLLRARLARLAPHIHTPHLHPPTLASQAEERFRERTRMTHRHEFLVDQLEVFEKVYESCAQRASDFMLTRSSNMLEWVIIVLLITQIVLTGFEMLSSMGQT